MQHSDEATALSAWTISCWWHGEKVSVSKNLSFPFGFWSHFCTLCSWSLISTITNALGEAESTHIFSHFSPFTGEGADGTMATYSPVTWEMEVYFFTELLPGIPIPAGTPSNILNQYHLCCSLIVRLSRSVSSWWKHLLSKVYEFWKALKNANYILSSCSFDCIMLVRLSSDTVQPAAYGSVWGGTFSFHWICL